MKKLELLARIEMLERRIAALEARPVAYPPISVPSVFNPLIPTYGVGHTITSTTDGFVCGPVVGVDAQ